MTGTFSSALLTSEQVLLLHTMQSITEQWALKKLRQLKFKGGGTSYWFKRRKERVIKIYINALFFKKYIRHNKNHKERKIYKENVCEVRLKITSVNSNPEINLWLLIRNYCKAKFRRARKLFEAVLTISQRSSWYWIKFILSYELNRIMLKTFHLVKSASKSKNTTNKAYLR